MSETIKGLIKSKPSPRVSKNGDNYFSALLSAEIDGERKKI